MILLELEWTSPDGWRWYVTITSNKLFTRKKDDCNLYNENYFFQFQLTQKIPTSWTSSLTIKKRQMRLTLIYLIDSKEYIHEWLNGWGRWGFIHIAVTLVKIYLLKVTQFSLSERFFKPIKVFSGIPSRDYCRTILLGDIIFVSTILTSRGCKRPCRKTLRIRADTVFECWKEIPLADLVHGIYLWSNSAQVSALERIVNLPHKASIKLCQKLRTVVVRA